MNFGFTDEQELLRSQVRKLLDESCPLEQVRKLTEAKGPGYSTELWQRIAELGWVGLTIPEAGGSIGAAWGVTEILKRTVPEERPDKSDRRSFPSGHASQSFAAAGSLHKRYGWQVGLPAHAVAAFVATARVKAKKHYVHDVLAGAVIGEASAWLIAQPKDSRVRWVPWGDTKSAGAAVSYRF